MSTTKGQGIGLLLNAKPACQFPGCEVEAIREGIIAFVNLRWVGHQLYCFEHAPRAERAVAKMRAEERNAH